MEELLRFRRASQDVSEQSNKVRLMLERLGPGAPHPRPAAASLSDKPIVSAPRTKLNAALLDAQMELSPGASLKMAGFRLRQAIRRLRMQVARKLRHSRHNQSAQQRWEVARAKWFLQVLMSSHPLLRARRVAYKRALKSAAAHHNSSLSVRVGKAMLTWQSKMRQSRHTRSRRVDPLNEWTSRIVLAAAWQAFKQFAKSRGDRLVDKIAGDLSRLRWNFRLLRARLGLIRRQRASTPTGTASATATATPTPSPSPTPTRQGKQRPRDSTTPLKREPRRSSTSGKASHGKDGRRRRVLEVYLPRSLPFSSPTPAVVAAEAPMASEAVAVASQPRRKRRPTDFGPFTSSMLRRASSALAAWCMRTHRHRVALVMPGLSLSRFCIERAWRRWALKIAARRCNLDQGRLVRNRRVLWSRRWALVRLRRHAKATAQVVRAALHRGKRCTALALLVLAANRFRSLRLQAEARLRVAAMSSFKLGRALQQWRKVLLAKNRRRSLSLRVRGVRLGTVGRRLLRAWVRRMELVAAARQAQNLQGLRRRRTSRGHALSQWYSAVYRSRLARAAVSTGVTWRRRCLGGLAFGALMTPLFKRRRQDRVIASFYSGRLRQVLCRRALAAWKAHLNGVLFARAHCNRLASVRSRRLCSGAWSKWTSAVLVRREAHNDEQTALALWARGLCRAALSAFVSRVFAIAVMQAAQARAAKYRRQLVCFAALSALRAGFSLAQRRVEARALLTWRSRFLGLAMRRWLTWWKRRMRLRVQLDNIVGEKSLVRRRARARGRAGRTKAEEVIWGDAKLRAAFRCLVSRLGSRLSARVRARQHYTTSHLFTALKALSVNAQRQKQQQRAAEAGATHSLAVGWDSFLGALQRHAVRHAQWVDLCKRAALIRLHKLFYAIRRAAWMQQQQEHRSLSQAVRGWGRMQLRKFRRAALQSASQSLRLEKEQARSHYQVRALVRGWMSLRAHVTFHLACAAFASDCDTKARHVHVAHYFGRLRDWALVKSERRSAVVTLLQQRGVRCIRRKLAMHHWQNDFLALVQFDLGAQRVASMHRLRLGWASWQARPYPRGRVLAELRARNQSQMRLAARHHAAGSKRRGVAALVSHMMLCWAHRRIVRKRLRAIWNHWRPLASSNRCIRGVLVRWQQRTRREMLHAGLQQWRWGTRSEALLEDFWIDRDEKDARTALETMARAAAATRWDLQQHERAAALRWRLRSVVFLWRSRRMQLERVSAGLALKRAASLYVAHRLRRVVFLLHLQLRYARAAKMFVRKCFLHFTSRSRLFTNRRRFHSALAKLAQRSAVRAALRHWKRESVRIRKSRRAALREGNPYLELNKPHHVLQALIAREEAWHNKQRLGRGLMALVAWRAARRDARLTATATCEGYLKTRRQSIAVLTLVLLRKERRRCSKRAGKIDIWRLARGIRAAFLSWTKVLCVRWASRAWNKMAAQAAHRGALRRGLRALAGRALRRERFI